MFKFEELCELIQLVGSTEVASVEIEHAGGRLRIDGKAPVSVMSPVVSAGAPSVQPVASVAVADAAGSGTSAEVSTEEDDLHYVTSPIVGTFYRAPNPDADPYVRVGDAVEGGRTLCIVEAMKLMNEIESDSTGTIVKVFPEDAQAIEFGERLFALRQS